MKHRLLCASAALISLSLPEIAFAQDMNPIDYCRENSDGKKERIACLEDALRGFLGETESVAATPTQEPSEQPAEQLAEAPDEPTGLGAEQVIARNKTIAEVEEKHRESDVVATLSDFAITRSGTYVFFLDNGQIWRQKPADSNRIRLSKKRDYTVKVSKGTLSGYRLEIEALRRSLLVERIK
ncbi:hypothetical protein [Hyphococcus sp. DH-69]|uniref:hypothetical protein n=1 Tax=Hyphococcus formosus TaxID=3143534 RepID=UPI00398AB149